MITTRDLAGAAWLIVLLLFALSQRGFRASLVGIMGAFFKGRMLAAVALYVIYISTWIWLAAKLGLWDELLLKDSFLWFGVSGFPLLFKIEQIVFDDHFLRKSLSSIFAVSIIAEFFIGIISFNLFVELAMQLMIAGLWMVSIISGLDRDRTQIKRLCDDLLSVVGMIVFVVTMADLFRQRHTLDFVQLTLSLALTIWLPLVALPFLYLFALVASYELLFLRLGYAGNNPRVARLAVLVGVNGHIRDVHAFRGCWLREVAEAPDFRTALLRLREFREQQSTQRATEREREDHFRLYAGVDGVDVDGKRLDQREFAETKRALRMLADCQMGWYHNPGSRYRSEFMGILGGTTFGLPQDHGIVIHIRDDVQAWYAWRRTVSGWVFAVGAASEPSDQWFYDGPNPPDGFPDSDPNWDHFAPDQFAINW